MRTQLDRLTTIIIYYHFQINILFFFFCFPIQICFPFRSNIGSYTFSTICDVAISFRSSFNNFNEMLKYIDRNAQCENLRKIFMRTDIKLRVRGYLGPRFFCSAFMLTFLDPFKKFYYLSLTFACMGGMHFIFPIFTATLLLSFLSRIDNLH